jgi:imidazoleglycerol-phosphate dehydratase
VAESVAEITRETRESRIALRLSLSSAQPTRIELEPPFARHMIETFAKWSGLGIELTASSKDGIEHHAVEDAAIAIGRGLRGIVDTGKVARVGHAVVPMDDALVLAAVDLVERPWFEGPIPDTMMEHVLRSIATEGALCLHVVVLRGKDDHHVTEAAFKAFGKALRAALEPRAERLSTKGEVDLRLGSR